MRIHALAGALLLCWTTVSHAEEPKPTDLGKTPTEEAKAEAPKSPPFTFALHGFVSGSVYMQDASLGPSEGQQSLFVNSQPPKQPNADKMIFGGDVRQSRFNFSVAGPQLPAFGGATPRAVLEIDFFGGFGSGNYGDVSVTPRLRWAYAELDWGGGNRVLFGQTNDLIFTIAPASLAHIAFPFGYGSGNIGWRRPGIFGFHTLGDKKAMNLEFAWEVGRSQWADAGGIGNNTVTSTAGTNTAGGDAYGFSNGVASGIPAVEARLMLASGGDWSLFSTGHYQRIDRSGVGALPTTTGGISSDLDVIAVNAGGKAKVGPLQLAATGFAGKNLAPLVGNFLQFNPNNRGDIHAVGGWVQAGFNLTKQLSIWGYAGIERPDEAEAIASGYTKLRNVTTVGMLQYRDSVKVGGASSDYAIGFEWIHMVTRSRQYATAAGVTPVVTAATAAGNSGDLDGNQWILSGNYFF
ncbi:hypothetical protein [Anaeromyxobacter diazotrophicus]|uniref:Porin n=1 Tax=Anaeromyxobacter diazotrophicus TaxID=2590199 RepID=A0A7I9VK68_9BACT|nr:hypothetical protein [Anaeromyxobacter diazotrophicus]GEJ56407.1 hypothetical protein AMYX_11480 [Anaeromyxobacter diazotrophicus]